MKKNKDKNIKFDLATRTNINKWKKDKIKASDLKISSKLTFITDELTIKNNKIEMKFSDFGFDLKNFDDIVFEVGKEKHYYRRINKQ